MKRILLLLAALLAFSARATTLYIDQAPYNAAGDGVTDDLPAFQQAVNDLPNGGTIKISYEKVYRWAGAYTSPPGATLGLIRSQLHLPTRSLDTNTIITIQIESDTEPAMNLIWTGGALPLPTQTGAIILCTVPGVAATIDSMIGGAGPAGGTFPITAVSLVLRNVTLRNTDNPSSTPLNLFYTADCDIEHVVVDTGQGGGAQSYNANGAAAIILPGNNNWCKVLVHDVDIRGYYRGIKVSEHANVDAARISVCDTAFEFTGGTHALKFGQTIVQGCRRGVQGPPAGGWLQRIEWADYEVEHSIFGSNSVVGDSTWANSMIDFDDPNHGLKGIVHYATVQSGVGANDNLVRNTGPSLAFFSLDAGNFLNSAVTGGLATSNTVFAITPALGQWITNGYATTMDVTAFVAYNYAHGNGECGLNVIISGVSNNTIGKATTASTVAESNYTQVCFAVPSGSAWRIASACTGANSISLFNVIESVH